MKALVINGPNLNMMHFTEPGVAGQLDYNGLLDYLELCCTQMGMEVEFFSVQPRGRPHRRDPVCRRPGRWHHPESPAATPTTASPSSTRCASAVCLPWKCCSASPTSTSPSARRTSSRSAVGPLHRRGHQRLSPRCRLSGPSCCGWTASAHTHLVM